jgi:hypothetical protein
MGQMLPLRDWARYTAHGGGLTWSDATFLSATFKSLWRLAMPDFFGGNAEWQWSTSFYPHEENAYFGVLPLVLALCAPLLAPQRFGLRGAAKTFRVQDSPVLWWLLWLWLPVVVVIALGDNTPVYRWLYDYVGLFRLTRVPERWLDALILPAALLSAVSFDALARPLTEARVRRFALSGSKGLVVLLVLLAVMSAWVTLLLVRAPQAFWIERVPAVVGVASDELAEFSLRLKQAALTDGLKTAFLLCVWAALLACLAGAPTQPMRQRWTRALLGVVVFDLLFVFWGSSRSMSGSLWREDVRWPPAITRFYAPGQRWDANVSDQNINGGLPSGIAIYNGYDPMSGRDFWRFSAAVANKTGHYWAAAHIVRRRTPLLYVAGVTHTLFLRQDFENASFSGGSPYVPPMPGAQLVKVWGWWELWRHPNAWPRTYLSRQVHRVVDEQQLPLLKRFAERRYASKSRPVGGGPWAVLGCAGSADEGR